MEIDIRPYDRGLHQPLLEPLTQLLHEAYAPLAAQGLLYTAGHPRP